ncbi:hypothetical protein ACQP2U_43295 (plasmid) [Nocardia sp. CA-084685]|uniref:hypothetical protein n=1 Tax=Nocardia sp. CA-084685 TaxID=3239970 RepID=UPI003D964028
MEDDRERDQFIRTLNKWGEAHDVPASKVSQHVHINTARAIMEGTLPPEAIIEMRDHAADLRQEDPEVAAAAIDELGEILKRHLQMNYAQWYEHQKNVSSKIDNAYDLTEQIMEILTKRSPKK